MNALPALIARLRRRWRGAVMAGVTMAAAGWFVVPWAAPLPESLLKPQAFSPLFLSAEGKPLRQLLTADGQKVAEPVSYEQLPPAMIHALLAAEDKRFFSHGGLDLLAVLRAATGNAKAGRVTSGASTLTQQLIKVSSEPQRRTLRHKIWEALQARHLEMRWSKEDILTAYLNRVSFGNLLTGIQSAAYGYFGKPLQDLTPAECALLASLPQAPGRLNPRKNLPAVQKRQQRILQLMHDNGWLEDEALMLALQEKPVLHRHATAFMAPHAAELAAMGLPALDSRQITTTIDHALQQHVEAVIDRHLNRLTDRHVTQAAAVVIENSSGRVLALAGSRDFFNSTGGQINGAWSPQSPGSALKPFTYLLALQHGYTAASLIADLPVEYATPTGLYRPENYDRRLYGPVTLRQALGSSLNIPAVRVLQSMGGEHVLLESLQQLGLTTLTEPADHYGLGLTIGNAPVRLLELTNAYATLARLGRHLPWTLRPSETPAGRQLFAADAAYVIADILADNQARLVTFGPRSVIRLPFPCAVKTGTSSNYRDNWTLGFTPEYSVGVWAGNFDNTPMNQVSGVTGAGPIFRDVFSHLHRTRGVTWYAEPDSLIRRPVDPRLGKMLAARSPASRISRQELFIAGTEPAPATSTDYEPGSGRAYLPAEYAAWLRNHAAWQGDLFAIRPAAISAPQIISPTDGSTFVLDPDLPHGGSHLLLRCNQSDARWSSGTLQIIQKEDRHYAVLTPGDHTLSLRQNHTDAVSRVRIHVRPPLQRSTFPSQARQ